LSVVQDGDWRRQAAGWKNAGETVKLLTKQLRSLQSQSGFESSCGYVQLKELAEKYRQHPSRPPYLEGKRIATQESDISSILSTYSLYEPMVESLLTLRNGIRDAKGRGKEVLEPTKFTVQTGAPLASRHASRWPFTSSGKSIDNGIWRAGDDAVSQVTEQLVKNWEAKQGWDSTIASGLWQAATFLPITVPSTIKNVTQSFGARNFAGSDWMGWMGDHERGNTGSWYGQIWTRLQGEIPSEWNWAKQTEISVADLDSLSSFAKKFRPGSTHTTFH
jgi:hypothetical protein